MIADYQRKGIIMKKKILAVVLGLTLCLGMTGCASWDRAVTDMKSDVNGGMQRTITVYTADGKELATYKGKIDIGAYDGGYVKFDFNGKRYIYYNCFALAEIFNPYSTSFSVCSATWAASMYAFTTDSLTPLLSIYFSY